MSGEIDSSPVDVTVSIVGHENCEGLTAALGSLEADKQRGAKLQVVVVDNASEDGSASSIRNAFPWAEVIQRERRGGFGANHNLALARAGGRYVLLLNDDTVVRPGAIDTLLEYLDDHPSVALAAPRVVDRAERTQATAWRQPTPILDLINAVSLGRRPRALSKGAFPRQVGWAMGCALLARQDALRAVEGFDESYFMYSEEIDLARRMAAAGFETHWVPAAVVVHEGHVSTGGHGSSPRAVEMARSRRNFWARYYSRPGRLIAVTATSLMFLALTAASIVRGGDWRPFWLQARESWGHTSHPGLREQAAQWNARADLNAQATGGGGSRKASAT